MNAQAQLETSYKSCALERVCIPPYYHIYVRVRSSPFSFNNEKTQAQSALKAGSGSDA